MLVTATVMVVARLVSLFPLTSYDIFERLLGELQFSQVAAKAIETVLLSIREPAGLSAVVEWFAREGAWVIIAGSNAAHLQ